MATKTIDLTAYYENIQKNAYLPTLEHAHRWSDATLKTFGFHMKRGTKKKLAQALPEELAKPLTRVFWLVHFFEPALPLTEFQKQVAKRAGVTDAQFALIPIKAVLREVKQMIDQNLIDEVAEALPDEVAALWREV